MIHPNRSNPKFRMRAAALLSGSVIFLFAMVFYGFQSVFQGFETLDRYEKEQRLANEINANFQLAVSKAKNFTILKDELNERRATTYFQEAKRRYSELTALDPDPKEKEWLLNLGEDLITAENSMEGLFSAAQKGETAESLYRHYLKDMTIGFEDLSLAYVGYLDQKIDLARARVVHAARIDLKLTLLGIFLALAMMGLSYLDAEHFRRAFQNEAFLLRKLRESQERYERFVEVTKEGILVHEDGVILDVNPRFLEMTGFEAKDLIGTRGEAFWTEGAAQRIDSYRKHGYLSWPHEGGLMRKNGKLLPVELDGRSFNFEGKELRVVSFWDVTERKNVEESLRKSEEVFRTLIESAPDPIMVHRDKMVLYVNSRFLDFMGFGVKSQVLGCDPLALVHPDDRPLVLQRMERTLKGEANPSVRVQLLKADGTGAVAEATSIGIPFQGELSTMVALRDISEKIRVEEALKASEERFDSLLENSNDVILLAGADTRIRYVSSSVRKVLGYGPEEKMGRSFFDLIHPEDQPMARSLLTEYGYQFGKTITAEVRALHRDGTWRYLEVVGTNLLNHPTIQGLIFNYRDITDRKMAEVNFRNLIEKYPDAIIIHDQERMLYANPAFLQLARYEKLEEVVGKGPEIVVPPEEREKVRARLSNLQQLGSSNPPVERPILRKDGSRLPVEATSFSMLFQGKLAAVVVLRDLTERKNVEQTLMKFERLSAIGEMAAGIAHEIRNPLASISAAAQLMKRKLKKEEQPDNPFVETILEQAERLNRLVLDTLSFARGGEKPQEVESFPVADAVESALRLCQVQYGPTHSKVKVEKPPFPEGLNVIANPQRIQQILVNLILNAYQAMPEGGVMSISAASEEESVLIRVGDTGPGVPPGVLSRIFEPFFTTKGAGSGLGLAIGQKIAREYGGKIEVENTGSPGAVFALRMPKKGTVAS